jgi:hypothetical protein
MANLLAYNLFVSIKLKWLLFYIHKLLPCLFFCFTLKVRNQIIFNQEINMRELAFNEVSCVAGGATPNEIANFIGDRIASSILAGVAGAVTGGSIGYLHGGDAMGVWGLSIIGQMVGGVVAGAIGGIGGVIGGLLVPLDYCYPLAIEAFETVIGGKVN